MTFDSDIYLTLRARTHCHLPLAIFMATGPLASTMPQRTASKPAKQTRTQPQRKLETSLYNVEVHWTHEILDWTEIVTHGR